MTSSTPFDPESLFHVTLASDPARSSRVIPDAQGMDMGSTTEPSLPDDHPLNAPTSSHERSTVDRSTVDRSLLQFVDDIACSANRNRAIECMSGHLSAMFPDTSIRFAMGTNQIRRFYDHRLGWLSTQSSLRVDYEELWENLVDQNPSSTEAGDGATISQHERGIEITFPQPSGDGRLVIWVQGEMLSAQVAKQLATCLPLLRNVFWRRPRVSTPQVLSQLGSRARLYSAIALATLCVLAVWPTQYPVDCTAKVEPLHQRLVCVPFEATLLESNVRPGDSVKEGDALAILDGRPLRLELESIESEIMQAGKEHNVALATGKIAEAQQYALQRERLARKADLINDRLRRLTVVSPIDGVVVSGDLDRFIGASLELGQTIIEVAPLDQMAIEIEIPEHEIGFVNADCMTRVRLNSIDGPSIRQPLNDLYPTSQIRDDRNVFVGRMIVDNHDLRLRPGLRGNATTYGPRRPLAWSWVRGGWEQLLWWLGY